MTERSKGPLRRIWDKIVDKVGEQIATWLLTFVSLVLVPALLAWLTPARHWVANEWICIRKPWCEVQGWSLGALIATTAAMTLAAVYLGFGLYRARCQLHATVKTDSAARPSFRRITVEDERLNLRWFVRRPPTEWLHLRNIALNVTPSYVLEILDGPFHAVAGCSAPLEESWGRLQSGPTLSGECPSCGQKLFRPRPLEHGFGDEPVNAYHVRAQALEELQRMERNGVALNGDAPIVLERPAYWNVMLPPRALKTQK